MRSPQPTSPISQVSSLVEYLASPGAMVVWEYCVPRHRPHHYPHHRHQRRTAPLVHPKHLRAPSLRNVRALCPFWFDSVGTVRTAAFQVCDAAGVVGCQIHPLHPRGD